MEEDQFSGCDDRTAKARADFALPANRRTFRRPCFGDVRAQISSTSTWTEELRPVLGEREIPNGKEEKSRKQAAHHRRRINGRMNASNSASATITQRRL